MKLLKYIDMLGSQISLNYKGKQTLQTQIGGVLTLLVAILGIALLIYFGQDIFEKRSPTILLTKYKSNHSEVYLKDYPFFITMVDSAGIEIPNFRRFMDISGSKMILHQNSTHPAIFDMFFNYTITTCKREHFRDNVTYVKALEQGLTERSFCMDYNDDDKFYNEWANMNSSWFTIFFSMCNNETRNEGDKCATKEEIDHTTTDFFVLLRQLDNIITAENYTTPYSSFFYTTAFTATKDLYKIANIRVKTAQIDTDDGVLFSVINSRKTFQFDNLVTDLWVKSTLFPDRKFLFQFESPRTRDIYVRTYVKLQYVIANIGGMFNFLVSIASVVSAKISGISFNLQEAKDVIFFDLLEENSNKDSSTMPAINEIKQQINNELIDFSTGEVGVDKITIIPFNKKVANPNEVEIRKKTTEKLKLIRIQDRASAVKFKSDVGFYNYIKYTCLKKPFHKEKDIYESLIYYIDKHLEISSFIKMQKDLSTFKNVFFSGSKMNEHMFNLKIPLSEVYQEYAVKNSNEDSKSNSQLYEVLQQERKNSTYNSENIGDDLEDEAKNQKKGKEQVEYVKEIIWNKLRI